MANCQAKADFQTEVASWAASFSVKVTKGILFEEPSFNLKLIHATRAAIRSDAQPPNAHSQPTGSDKGYTNAETIPAMTDMVKLNILVTKAMLPGVCCLITGATKVLAKPMAKDNKIVPIKKPFQVVQVERMIIPAVNTITTAIRVFSSP